MHPIRWIEQHGILLQSIAAITTALGAVLAFLVSVKATRLIASQTSNAAAQLSAGFRPIVEVSGGLLTLPPNMNKIDLVNKGQGAAINFRWRCKDEPANWRVTPTNVIAPGEKFQVTAAFDWRSPIILAYTSGATNEEIETRVEFALHGQVSNEHSWDGAAGPRQGWTRMNSELAFPAYRDEFIATLPIHRRFAHWIRLKRGKERRI